MCREPLFWGLNISYLNIMEGREIAQYELRTKVALNAHLDQVYDTIINPIIRKSCRIVASQLPQGKERYNFHV